MSLLKPILNASLCHLAKNRAEKQLKLMKPLNGGDSKQDPGTESCIPYGEGEVT